MEHEEARFSFLFTFSIFRRYSTQGGLVLILNIFYWNFDLTVQLFTEIKKKKNKQEQEIGSQYKLESHQFVCLHDSGSSH